MILSLVIFSVLVTGTGGVPGCVAGWTLYEAGNTCMFYQRNSYSFSSAQVECQVHTANLVKVTGTDKRDFIQDVMLLTDPSAQIWIGVNDPDSDFVYTYLDGTALGDYKPFDPDPETEANSAYSCAFSAYDAAIVRKWVPANCGLFKQSVCEKPAIDIPMMCEEETWQLSSDERSCTRIIRSKRKSFDDARAFCQMKGADLAQNIVSLDQRNNVMTQVSFRANFWIGVSSQDTPGTYMFIDGTAVGTDPPFKTGRPSVNNESRCGTLKQGLWYDKDCNRRYFFVCEKPSIAV